jgi:hypothetical protein
MRQGARDRRREPIRDRSRRKQVERLRVSPGFQTLCLKGMWQRVISFSLSYISCVLSVIQTSMCHIRGIGLINPHFWPSYCHAFDRQRAADEACKARRLRHMLGGANESGAGPGRTQSSTSRGLRAPRRPPRGRRESA